MKTENLYKEPHDTNSIREQLQIIKKYFFDGDELSRIQSDSLSTTNLVKAMDYLEDEKDQLPRFYRKEIDFILGEVRYKLTHERNS
jgi:hypothetical protein